ncbi:MAG TPA: sulfite exporter TauE/SafE family protein [Methylomirabilota bacterium]|nr:sulfite exporter TauE/SafE family protein [Methylomirabilota bacterium]
MVSVWATIAGAGAGLLGGLIGLGGAEFRLPLLVAIFHYALRRAISLNLAISFVAVLVGAAARWWLGGQAPLWSAASVAVAMMVGGMLGAAVGSRWLARVSDTRLHAAVRSLLIAIGILLVAEGLGSWTSPGLPLGDWALYLIAFVAGLGIGAVSTLLGVAGGELIIPTLVLGFGLPIKAAGTMSLLISVPTMVIGLWRHQASGAFHDVRDLQRIVLPMALGTVLGSTLGGWLVVHVPASAVKLLLGCVLIASALRVFKVRALTPATTDRLA